MTCLFRAVQSLRRQIRQLKIGQFSDSGTEVASRTTVTDRAISKFFSFRMLTNQSDTCYCAISQFFSFAEEADQSVGYLSLTVQSVSFSASLRKLTSQSDTCL